MGALRTTRTAQSARLRQVVVISVVCLAVYCFLLAPEQGLDSSRSSMLDTFPLRPLSSPKQQKQSPAPPPPELLNNRFLTAAQCRASFPGLTREVDDAVAKGPFTLRRSKGGLGPLIARIRDGKLYILSATRKSDLSRDMLAHRSATLHQIANALLTAPRPPSSPSSSSSSSSSSFSVEDDALLTQDIILAFNHNDDPSPSTFSYSRPADPALNPADRHYFPIPHFSFYSWPLPFVGSFGRAAEAITALEDEGEAKGQGKEGDGSTNITPDGQPSSSSTTSRWASKHPKAVWRGTAHFNNPRAGRLRQDLILATRDKAWADVEALDWTTASSSSSSSVTAAAVVRNATNALRVEDFCRYRYVIHTEGITYSGRFQFHQLCGSVVLTPPVAWMQHTTHLLRPLFSSSLYAAAGADDDGSTVGVGVGVDVGVDVGDHIVRKPIQHHPHQRDEDGKLAPYPLPWTREAWPTSYAPDEANIVFVAPDWSDLESTVAWLEGHPGVAEGIARRQRELFHGGGYFSAAAEMCYWRALIRGWGEVVRTDGQGFEELDEMPWEEFSLKEIHK